MSNKVKLRVMRASVTKTIKRISDLCENDSYSDETDIDACLNMLKDQSSRLESVNELIENDLIGSDDCVLEEEYVKMEEYRMMYIGGVHT